MPQLQRETPEKTGVPSIAVRRFLETLDRHEIPLHSVLIARHGRLISEAYYAPYEKHTLHRMFSVTKSFTSLAAGLLCEDGMIKLTDSICSYFPEYLREEVHPWLAATTIEDMLMMKTCHSKTTYKKTSATENWVRSFFWTEPDHRPGTVFMYDTSASHTLCALVEKLTGQAMLDFLKDRFLRKIGFSEESYILKDPFGTSMGGSGLMALPEDLLRLGLLLMNKGRDIAYYGTYKGEQLYPEDYISWAVSYHGSTRLSHEKKAGYGGQFWLLPFGGYACLGMGDQLLLCYPEQDLILVITGDTQGMQGTSKCIYDAVYQELFPYLSAGEVTPCEEEERKLRNYLAHLTIPVLEGGEAGRQREINGQRYALQENSLGFQEMGVEFDKENQKGVLRYTWKELPYEISFGTGRLITGIFPVYGQKYAASAAWLDTDTLYILCWLTDESTASVHFKLCFQESHLTVQMSKTEETKFLEYQGLLNGEQID